MEIEASRPIVGIPTHSRDVPMAGLPPAYVMGQHYTSALAAVGAAAILIPLYQDAALLRTLYEQIDGLFLAGGSDVDPACYNESPHPKLGVLDVERDRVECQLLAWAFADRMPILAVCRGVQIMNVAAGGSLFQDIGSQVAGAIEHDYWQHKMPRDYLAHPVEVLGGSRLGHLLGVHDVAVNSLHHQAIREVALGFRATAWASDGVIEGIESTNCRFAVGVQWHPEALIAQEPMRGLFGGFVEAALAYRRSRRATPA
jgi:putative glutamine amidotransferase